MEMETEMAEERQWAEMLPEALAGIFTLLPLMDILATLPRVCKAWKRVSCDVVCWQAVELSDWSKWRSAEDISRMVKLVIDRSHGCLKKLSVANLDDEPALTEIASSGDSLQTLCIPCSKISDSCIQVIASQFHIITHLDISECPFVTKSGLEELGRCCKSLVRLDRNMSLHSSAQGDGCEDEAIAIAQHMSQLQHLELCDGSFTNRGLCAILKSCINLQHLDIRGCRFVEIEGDIAKKCSGLKVFYQPYVEDSYDEDLEDWEDPWAMDRSYDKWDKWDDDIEEWAFDKDFR